MSIDSCYEAVVKELATGGSIVAISKHLITLKSLDDTVLYIYGILKSLQAFPDIQNVVKCEEISMFYRNLGNKRFKQSDDYRAWQYYNLSLLYAPLGTECYSLALANRSAVFFSLRKFNECIIDIEKVLAMTYPEKLKEKLNKRKALCKEKSNNNDKNGSSLESTLSFPLLDPQHPRFPCASSKLEVVFSEEMGRHVIAKTDIKVGEVLADEDPYFTLLLKSQYLFACSYCLSRDLNLIPCHNCCFALYCSENCRLNALKDYHDVECSLMATLIEMEFTKLELLALRTVIKARNDHSDWDSLFCAIAETEEINETEFRGHVKVNGEWVYDSKYYASIHTLASNIDKRSVSDIFQKGVSAAVFLWLLEQKTTFLKSDEEKEELNIRKYAASTLLHHIMTSPTNMHGIGSCVETSEGDYSEEYSIASAPYAFHSLVNHSCAPNIVRFSKLGTGKMTMFALRPIKKGMQLFDNYGSHHAIHDRATRQKQLKSQYKFTCLCEACVNDWPTYFVMGYSTHLPLALQKRKEKILCSDVIEKLQKGDLATAELMYKPLCELAEELDPYAPCMELADCQESMKQCLQLIRGVVPYGYSKLVDWTITPPESD